jgi:hypothetical protein
MDSTSSVITFPNKPADRLRVALRELELALADQAMAFQEFRMNMALLGTSVGGLERSLESYRGTLDAVAGDVATAHRTAREVEARAEAMLR